MNRLARTFVSVLLLAAAGLVSGCSSGGGLLTGSTATGDAPGVGGKVARWNVFDAPSTGGRGRVFGQERGQAELVKYVKTFAEKGRIDKLLGDGVLAVFGVPQTHESDPERAIHAAIEIRAAAQELGLEVARGRVRRDPSSARPCSPAPGAKREPRPRPVQRERRGVVHRG